MKSLKRLAPPCLALLLLSAGATAQQVYRCGSSYSQTPCGADAVAIQADDPRTEAQRAAAQQGLVRDKALAKEMEAARHRDESMALARIKAEQAAQAGQARKTSAQKKSEEKKARQAQAGSKSKKSAGLRTVKVQEPGVFTAETGASPAKKTKTKAKTSAP